MQLYDRLKDLHPNVTVYLKKDIPERFFLKSHRRTPPLLLVADKGYAIQYQVPLLVSVLIGIYILKRPQEFFSETKFFDGGVQLLVLGLTRVLTIIKRTAKSLIGSTFGGALVEMTSFDQRVIYVRILL